MCLERGLANISISVKKIPMVERRLKIVKPRLPRKVAPSCKINLNKYWTDLEDHYQGKTSSTVLTFKTKNKQETKTIAEYSNS